MSIELLESLAVIATPIISIAQTVIVWWGIRAMVRANAARARAQAVDRQRDDQRHNEIMAYHKEAARQADQRHAETMAALHQQGEALKQQGEALHQQGEALKALIEQNRQGGTKPPKS